jgi:Predicted membrane protein (DUF2232)
MTDTTSLQHEPVGIPERSFGRIVRSVLGYALLVALMFISPLYVFLPAALFACAIRNGKPATMVMLAFAAVTAFYVNTQAAHVPGVASSDAMLNFAYYLALVAAVSIPAFIVLPMVERGEAFGRVLITAVLIGVIGLAATEAAMRTSYHFSPYAELALRTHRRTAEIIPLYEKGGVPPDVLGVVKRWMDIGVTLLPSFFLIDIIVVFVLSLVMFGRLKAWREFVTRRDASSDRSPIAAAYLFRNFALPEWLLFAFVIGGITPLASGMLQKVAANILAVVAFLYLLQGLAIFRFLLVAVGAGFGGVMFGYLLLGILTITGISPFLLSIAGLFDSFFDFRHFRRKDHSDESHPH